MYKTAIILAAGQGSRLKPLTNVIPKPLVPVTDKTIIHNALECLEGIGVTHVYIVTGYLNEILQTELGKSFRKINIFYVFNDKYATTNSMFSLLSGLKQVPKNQDVLILEGDVFFESSVLSSIPTDAIIWLADSSITNLDGCYLASKANKVIHIGIYKHDEIKNYSKVQYAKSAGIMAVNKYYINQLIEILEKGVADHKVNLYYDLIVAEYVDALDIKLLDISGKKWFEIDSANDLQVCQKIFNYDKNSINNN